MKQLNEWLMFAATVLCSACAGKADDGESMGDFYCAQGACNVASSLDGGSATQQGAAGTTQNDQGSGSGQTQCTPPATPAGNEWLAFDSDASGLRQIYLMDFTSGADPIQLESAMNDLEPAFSPDGTSLAFTSDREGTLQIFVMDLATRDVRRVSEEPAGASQPHWSRDGASIVARGGSVSLAVNPSLRATASTDSTIVEIDLSDSSSRVVAGFMEWASFEHPDTAPCGGIVADRYNMIADLSGGTPREIVRANTFAIGTPSVSWDGTQVAYSAACGTSGGLALLRPDLVNGQDIWVTPFAETLGVCSTTRITPDGTGYSRRPAFSPHGKIAFERGTDQADILVHENGELTAVVSWPSDERNPSWSVVEPRL